MLRTNRKRIVGVLVLMYGALFIFLGNTDPRKLPAISLLVPLLWLFVALFLTVIFISGKTELRGGNYRTLGYAAIIAGVPTGLLLLSSINQLTLKDIMLVGLFTIIVLIYLGRFRLERKIE